MQTTILANVDLGEGWAELEVEAPELAPHCRAGQFIQVRVGDGDDPLIRRPFSVYDVGPEPGPGAHTLKVLYQVVGPGTRWMARRREGEHVDLLGPLGQPFPALEHAREIILVGGGIGVAPLYFYSRELSLRPNPPRHQVLLGARYSSLLVGAHAFEDLGTELYCATDDGSRGFHGNVVQLLQERLEQVQEQPLAGIGCGPHGMNVALRNHAVDHELDFWISLENYMPCGFGACYGCVLPVPGTDPVRYRRVCVEGPVFPAREIPAAF